MRRRSNPSGIVGLGLLTTLEILNPSTGATKVMKLRGKWLAWDPSHRCFHVCTLGRSNPGLSGLPPSVTKAHRRFHKAPPKGSVMANVPDSSGGEVEIGRVKALIYRVPKSLRSPEKNDYIWHHAFGDTGHKGGDSYPVKVMPALVRDRAGNLFIRRRPGNIFRVDTWLRG